MRVVTLSEGQVEELRKLTLDEEDYERRMRSARNAKQSLLIKAAGIGGPDERWRLTDDGKQIIVGQLAGQWN